MRTKLGRTVAALVAIAVTCVAVIGGCTRDDEEPSATEPSDTSSAAPDKPPVTTELVVGRVSGSLRAQRKTALKEDVKAIMDGFFEGAYLGDFPRASYADAYADFTPGAREDADRDADLLSNAALSDRIDSAVGVKRKVSIDVLAVKGMPQGVTARFTLDFDTSGDLERRERVKGYLLLNREQGTWQVFGYDVIRSVIPA